MAAAEPAAEAPVPAPEEKPAKQSKPPKPPFAPGSAEEWEKWAASCQVGVRAPLGADHLGRRFWVLGGRGGAWRVHVEAPDQGADSGAASWAWYEGARLMMERTTLMLTVFVSNIHSQALARSAGIILQHSGDCHLGLIVFEDLFG